jgi:CRISPR-associated protein Csx17
MPELVLDGCRPTPLAHYLKALAVLRLVAEQKDRGARGHWRGDRFVLQSSLDADALVRFFVDEYVPTPIVAPWNGGSGFWPKDNREGFDPVRQSTLARLSPYRQAIEASCRVLAALGLTSTDDGGDRKEGKDALLANLRAELPDEALAWMDAALALTPDGPRYPALLGTGGNDGRLDFSNNQLQRLAALLLGPEPADPALLRSALFDQPMAGLKELTIGQFLPAGQGGTNAGPGFEGRGAVNPWDYVLMVEGALVPSAAATRKLEAGRGGALSFPFMVRSSGVGYGSAAAKDEGGSRDEIWLPLWTEPATFASLRGLFAEGRARVPTRKGGATTAVTGADFSRALATLGVDRGVDAFVRYGFLKRNGLAYLATPLGRLRVRREPLADVLAPLDRWLETLRSAASDDRAPSSWRRARAEVERAVLDVCAGRSDGLLDLLFALASAERAFARLLPKAIEKYVRPVPALPAESWLSHIEEDSPEFRLARSLAGAGFRRRMVPVTERSEWDPRSNRVTFGGGALVDDLVETVLREAVEHARDGAAPPAPTRFARLPDLDAWLQGRVDDARLGELIHALSLLSLPEPTNPARSGRSPGAAWATCALVHDRHPLPGLVLPHTPRVASLLAADRVSEAVAVAAGRLVASGVHVAVPRLEAPPRVGRRLAAALAFPISVADRAELLRSLGYRPEASENPFDTTPSSAE